MLFSIYRRIFFIVLKFRQMTRIIRLQNSSNTTKIQGFAHIFFLGHTLNLFPRERGLSLVLRASTLLFEFHLRVNAVRTVRRKPCGMRSFSLASELQGKEPPSSKVLAPFREPPSPSTSLSGGRGGPFLVTRCLALAGGKQSRSDGAESDTSPALTLNFSASISISQS